MRHFWNCSEITSDSPTRARFPGDWAARRLEVAYGMTMVFVLQHNIAFQKSQLQPASELLRRGHWNGEGKKKFKLRIK